MNGERTLEINFYILNWLLYSTTSDYFLYTLRDFKVESKNQPNWFNPSAPVILFEARCLGTQNGTHSKTTCRREQWA